MAYGDAAATRKMASRFRGKYSGTLQSNCGKISSVRPPRTRSIDRCKVSKWFVSRCLLSLRSRTIWEHLTYWEYSEFRVGALVSRTKVTRLEIMSSTTVNDTLDGYHFRHAGFESVQCFFYNPTDRYGDKRIVGKSKNPGYNFYARKVCD